MQEDGPVLNERSITAGLRNWYKDDEKSYDIGAKFTLPLPQWVAKTLPVKTEGMEESVVIPDIVVRSRRGTIISIEPRPK